MEWYQVLVRPVYAIGRAVCHKEVNAFKKTLDMQRGSHNASQNRTDKSYYVNKSLGDLYDMRNIDEMAKSFFGLKIEDSAHFENVKRWLGVCCEARTWGNLSGDRGKVNNNRGTNEDVKLGEHSQEERLVLENLPDYVEAAYQKLFDEYYEEMKNGNEEALAAEFRRKVLERAVENMMGFDSLNPDKERYHVTDSCAGCGLPKEMDLEYDFHISTASLKAPFKQKKNADKEIWSAGAKKASGDVYKEWKGNLGLRDNNGYGYSGYAYHYQREDDLGDKVKRGFLKGILKTGAFLKGAVVNPWLAQAGAKYAIKEFLQKTDGTDSGFEKKSKNAIFAMPNVLAPLLFTKEKAKARWDIVKKCWNAHVDNQKVRLYIDRKWAKKSSGALYEATESLLEPKLRPLLAEYINLGIKENFYGNGHTGWLSSIYKSRKNLAEKIYFFRAKPIAKSIGVDATRRAQYWWKNAARTRERDNKARTRKARSAVLGKLDIKQNMIKKWAKDSEGNKTADPYGLNTIDDLNNLSFWGGLWAVHQEKVFAKTNLYHNQLLNLIVACKKYKRARGHLACTPALLRRFYWVEAVEAKALQELPPLRYSAWTQKAVGRKYKYKTEVRAEAAAEANV